MVYLWPELENTAANSALLFDGHANGLTLSDLLAMGTNNIAATATVRSGHCHGSDYWDGRSADWRVATSHFHEPLRVFCAYSDP